MNLWCFPREVAAALGPEGHIAGITQEKQAGKTGEPHLWGAEQGWQVSRLLK